MTITIVRPSRRTASRSSPRASSADSGSRGAVGASAKTISGSVTDARAAETRCGPPWRPACLEGNETY
ncbi:MULTISPECIES: hypothetical protein [unclassified Streptomyces]|uniref:hypothetical protein n=1 Tax=unclassified Streptomyces TaxID=2593676 RepID=UPI0037F8A94B